MLFNKQSNEERIDEIRNKISFYPKQTNAWELYKESGKSWTKIEGSKLDIVSWEDSWKEIPQEELDYIKSLPEFDAEVFKEITDIDVSVDDEVDVTVKGKTVRISRKSAKTLGLL